MTGNRLVEKLHVRHGLLARARFAGLTFVWVMLRDDGTAVFTEDRRVAAIVHSAGRPVRPMFTDDAGDVVSRSFATPHH